MALPMTSEDYVKLMKNRTASTKAQKRQAFEQIKKAYADNVPVAMNKIAQGFIGPVMMRLKYEGISRNILTEDPIAPGQVPVYDVLDEMGKAYFVENYQGEAKISQYEGKRLFYSFRHIAEFATVQEQDLLELTVDTMEYAINEAQQRIQETEDTFLFAMIDAAIDTVTAEKPDFSGQTTHDIAVTGDFEPGNFWGAAAKASMNRLDVNNIIINPADRFDIMAWPLTTTGVAFKDETFDSATPITKWGQFNILTSVMVEPGTAYASADSDYVGRMPIRKSLDIRNNDKLERFSLGAVLDEYINMIILNSGSLYRLKKA